MKKIYIPAYSMKSSQKVVKKSLRLLEGYKSVGLLTIAQHLNQMGGVKKTLEKAGFDVVEGGQILGCDIKAAKKIIDEVEVYLYVGSGRFHPLSVAYVTQKPVVVANPLSDFADTVGKEEIAGLKKARKARILLAYDANIFGVLVSTKEGQFSPQEAFKVKRKLETAGRRAFIFAGSEITPDNVLPFKVDAWVNTACPRIVEDFFDKPVLNEGELDMLLGG
ncbi:MAG: 2-(3-amino-3-carboxypropyl)histidine synthase subunit 1/2 [Candidatus Altiarchaeota archaeon]|nr:2-(3-amino-3-carboxypropyl)histidine synthase subunit 1/2 [Candidatus Altiarchaeota archaeon]